MDENIEGFQGGFTPGHLWFVLFLFVFSLVGLPLFLWLKQPRERQGASSAGSAVCRRCPACSSSCPALILVLPWLEKDDDLSGQPEIGFFIVVVLGFMLFGRRAHRAVIDRDWVWLLAVGLTASILYIWAEPRAGGWGYELRSAMYVGMKYLYEIGVWGMILGLLGLGHRFLTGGRRRAAVRDRGRLPVLHPAPDGGHRRRLRRLRRGTGRPWAKFTLIVVVSLGAHARHLRGRRAALGPGALPVRDEAEEAGGARGSPEPVPPPRRHVHRPP